MRKFDYLAIQDDFRTIEEGIKFVWNSRLSFIFKEKKLIKDTLIISFDSKNIYLWTTNEIPGMELIKCSLKSYNQYKIPHKINFSERERLSWHTGDLNSSILNLLPAIFRKNHFDLPKISGSLLGDFINIQKKIRGTNNNPYITRESYLATIVHEFAHVYFNQHKLWYFSDKTNNIKLLNNTLSLYLRKKNVSKIKPELPSPFFLSEVFAFCADYAATSIFWPNHKKDIDKASIVKIQALIKSETKKNLYIEDSVLNSNNPHDLALIFGKILVELSPKTWPARILNKLNI